MTIKTFAYKGGVSVALAVFAMVFLAIIGFRMSSADSKRPLESGEHVITIHDDREEQGFYTKASTLREALKQANVRLDPNDRTEPSLDEKLVANSYEVNIYRARPIIVRDGDSETRVISAYRTPEQIAKHAGLAFNDEDEAVLSPSRDIVVEGAAEVLSIDRATPFTFVFYGKTTSSYTQAMTVGDMLKRKNITLAANDTIEPAASSKITPNMTIKLWRNGKQTLTQEEEIPYETEKIKDANQEVGYKDVKTPGVNGKKTVTYEVYMENGVEVSRKSINENITKQPVKQVELVGTKMSNTFSGSFAEALVRLRSCEGSYTSNTGNGYYGAYQYDLQTWGGYMGYVNASLAPPEVQDQKAWETYQRRGWQPWPSCRIKMGLQDIYR